MTSRPTTVIEAIAELYQYRESARRISLEQLGRYEGAQAEGCAAACTVAIELLADLPLMAGAGEARRRETAS